MRMAAIRYKLFGVLSATSGDYTGINIKYGERRNTRTS